MTDEITCSRCGGEIDNKKLLYEVKRIRKLIRKKKYEFEINVTIYCCECLEYALIEFGIEVPIDKKDYLEPDIIQLAFLRSLGYPI